MPLEITFLGHAGFVLRAGGHTVAVDPFLTGNPVATMSVDDLECDTVCITHGHADHYGDAVALCKRTGATLIAAVEICTHAGEQGVKEEQLNPGNTGGRIDTPFGDVAFTPAFHSSSFEGRYMGQPCGLVIHFNDGGTFYHCGDTALFSDMKLIGELHRPDVAAIPCGDRFTMGPRLAAKAAQLIQPKVAIPIHYATWPQMLATDIGEFQPEGVKVQRMEPGQTWPWRG